jgi:hypothetical protein
MSHELVLFNMELFREFGQKPSEAALKYLTLKLVELLQFLHEKDLADFCNFESSQIFVSTTGQIKMFIGRSGSNPAKKENDVQKLGQYILSFCLTKY